MSMMNKRSSLKTKEKILDAAEDVFNEKGYSSATLNDIALAAQVTRGAIYWHFKNKEDLFDVMCSRVRDPLKEMIKKTAEDVDNPMDQLRKHFEFIHTQVIENPHYRKILNILFHKCEFTQETNQIVLQQREWQAYAKNMIQTALVNAQKKEQLPKDVDIELACNLLGFVFKGLLAEWLFTPESFDLRDYASRVNEAIFGTLIHNPHLRNT